MTTPSSGDNGEATNGRPHQSVAASVPPTAPPTAPPARSHRSHGRTDGRTNEEATSVGQSSADRNAHDNDDPPECEPCARGDHHFCTDDGIYGSDRACECYRSCHGESGGSVI